MKDVVLLAVSIYLLKQDVMRVSLAAARRERQGLDRWVANVNAQLHEQLYHFDCRSQLEVLASSSFHRNRLIRVMGVNWAILIRDDTKSWLVVVSVKDFIVDLFLLLDLISLGSLVGV
jgi:hypothetical protein